MASRGCLRWAMQLIVTCAGCLCPVVSNATALSDEQAQGVDLSLVRGEGADACITAEVLEDEVARRLGRNPFTRPVRQHIECLVLREKGAFIVRLYERDQVGRRMGDRELFVSTTDCRELDDAMALAVALLIDPEYLAGSPHTGELGTRASDVPTAKGSRPLGPRSSTTTTALSSVTLVEATGLVQPMSRGSIGDTRVMIGLGGSIGLLPRFGPDLSLSVQRRLLGWLHGHLSILYAPERTVPDIAPTVGFGLTALKLAGCAEGTEALAGFACAGMAVGAIHSVVYEPRPVNPGDRAWAAISADAGVRTAAGPVVVEVRGQLLAPFVRYKFNLVTGSGVYREAWVSPGLAFAVGTHFP
jgi:hypothetical protein